MRLCPENDDSPLVLPVPHGHEFVFLLWRKNMNRLVSHPNHENLVNTGYWKGSPPQGLSEARRGKVGFGKILGLKPPRERPRGGGGTYHNGGMGASAPISKS